MQNYVSKMTEVLKGKKLSFTITGGGTRAICMLLENGGASAIFAGAFVPYDTEWVDRVIVPDYPKNEEVKYCSKTMTSVMAKVEMENVVSCALNCSLKKDNEREGREHKCYISIYDTVSQSVADIEVEVPNLSRKEQEDYVSEAFLKVIYEFVTGESYND